MVPGWSGQSTGTPIPTGGYLAKHVLVAAYRQLVETGEWAPEPGVLERIRMKPVRTLLGSDHGDRADQALPLPGEVHLLPDGRAHAEELPAG